MTIHSLPPPRHRGTFARITGYVTSFAIAIMVAGIVLVAGIVSQQTGGLGPHG